MPRAIFLSADLTYTQGTARDLAEMSEIPDAEREATALSTLFSDESWSASSGLQRTALLQLQDLTDRQFAAARDMLSAPITVVQGPPGTGKSDVIVSVIASAVAAGQSVLFSSKNHQALDEVEKRLALFCGEAPILIRGRDAEGERDTNFLTELKRLQASEPRNPKATQAQPVLETLRLSETRKALRLHRTELEIDLANVLDRIKWLSPADENQTTVRKHSWLRHMFHLITRFFRVMQTNASRAARFGLCDAS